MGHVNGKNTRTGVLLVHGSGLSQTVRCAFPFRVCVDYVSTFTCTRAKESREAFTQQSVRATPSHSSLLTQFLTRLPYGGTRGSGAAAGTPQSLVCSYSYPGTLDGHTRPSSLPETKTKKLMNADADRVAAMRTPHRRRTPIRRRRAAIHMKLEKQEIPSKKKAPGVSVCQSGPVRSVLRRRNRVLFCWRWPNTYQQTCIREHAAGRRRRTRAPLEGRARWSH